MDAQRSRDWKQRATMDPLKSFLASNWPSGNELSSGNQRTRHGAGKLGALVPLARKRFFTKENLPL